MKHVFISYVHEDKAIVDQLEADLEVAEVQVWRDRDSIDPGKRWRDDIRSAIQEGDFFIACFSENYFRRDRTVMSEELRLAIAELNRKPLGENWFISVLLSDCEVPPLEIGGGATLHDLQWVHLYQDWPNGIGQILETIKKRPAPTPKGTGLLTSRGLAPPAEPRTENLTRCPDCSRWVSIDATACPGCGRPIGDEIDHGGVPGGARFGNLILEIPSFEEIGLPRLIAGLGHIESLIKPGQWVERGDVILKINYSFFPLERTILWWLYDPKEVRTFSLHSPVTGLVIALRKEAARLDHSRNLNYFDNESFLPVFLLPKDEPPPTDWPLKFYQEVIDFLCEKWQDVAFVSRSYRSIRFGEHVQDKNLWPSNAEIPTNLRQPAIKTFERRLITSKDKELLKQIDYLRRRDVNLRYKLSHFERYAS